MFERLLELIDGHPQYGPAVKQAVADGSEVVLNYHTHGAGQPYCVSIASRPRGLLPVVGQNLPLEELAHIKGIGQTEEQCRPLMSTLGEELMRHYSLDQQPGIYLNGHPLPEATAG